MTEGILVAKKDFNAPSHIDLHKIPNLQVIKACQSLTSRGYVKTLFSWQYYYYTLTNEGIGMFPFRGVEIIYPLESLLSITLLHLSLSQFCRSLFLFACLPCHALVNELDLTIRISP